HKEEHLLEQCCSEDETIQKKDLDRTTPVIAEECPIAQQWWSSPMPRWASCSRKTMKTSFDTLSTVM
ncbi:hypothetical protein J0S82_004360, partial [Galemys pyrenaicus]